MKPGKRSCGAEAPRRARRESNPRPAGCNRCTDHRTSSQCGRGESNSHHQSGALGPSPSGRPRCHGTEEQSRRVELPPPEWHSGSVTVRTTAATQGVLARHPEQGPSPRSRIERLPAASAAVASRENSCRRLTCRAEIEAGAAELSDLGDRAGRSAGASSEDRTRTARFGRPASCPRNARVAEPPTGVAPALSRLPCACPSPGASTALTRSAALASRGGLEGSRTPHPLSARQVLSQLSYEPISAWTRRPCGGAAGTRTPIPTVRM